MKTWIRLSGAALIALLWLLSLCQLTWHRPLSKAYHIDKSQLTHDAGHSFRWPLPKPARSNPEGLAAARLLEDGHRLTRSTSRKSVQAGHGFTLSDKGLYFSAIDGSDPRSNAATYLFLLPRLPSWVVWTLVGSLPFAFVAALGIARPILATLRGWFTQMKWFLAGESPHSYAVARITLAGVMLWTAFTRFDTVFLQRTAAVAAIRYDPVGIWCVLPHQGFPFSLVQSLIWLLPMLCLLLLLGLGGRAILALSLLAFWALACAEFSVTNALSHDFHGPLFIGLGLLLGWSNLIPFHGKPLLPGGRTAVANTRWALFGALACFAFIFFDAALYKVYLGNQEFLGWIFSDNLRNKLLVRYEVSLGQELPYLPSTLVASPLLCRLAALTAVIGQFLPLVGVFFLARPRWRWIFSASVAFCLIGLKITMGISWVLPWLPFALLFIDFDALATRFRSTTPLALPPPRFSRPVIMAFTLGLVLVIGASALGHQTRLLYPLGPFPMYSNIEAAKPFSKHLPFERTHQEWRWSGAPMTLEDQALFQRKFRGLLGAQDEIDSVIRSAYAWIRTTSGVAPSSIEVRRNDYRVEPHPSRSVTLLRSSLLARMEGEKVVRPIVHTQSSGQAPMIKIHLPDVAPEKLTLWSLESARPGDPFDPVNRLHQVTETTISGQSLQVTTPQRWRERMFLKIALDDKAPIYELVEQSTPGAAD